MRSAAKLSYEEAQSAIEGSPNAKNEPAFDPVLQPLLACIRCLAPGLAPAEDLLSLTCRSAKFFSMRYGIIERIFVPERLDAHKLIEEFMIQANVAAAEILEERRRP